MSQFQNPLRTASLLVGASLALGSCAINPIASETSLSLNSSRSDTLIGPYAGAKTLPDSLLFYVDKTHANVFSVDARLLDSDSPQFENGLLVLKSKQLSKIGICNDTDFLGIAIEINGKQLSLLTLPECKSIYLATVKNSYISITNYSALTGPNQGKPGLLFIIGGKQPYQILFAYQNDAGKITISQTLDKDFPGQFKNARDWHKKTIGEISKLGQIEQCLTIWEPRVSERLVE